jgi:hypothetical protein
MKIKNIHLIHFKRTDLAIFKHRLSLFCTLDFIILSLIAFGCICFLMIFIIRYSFIISGRVDNAGNDIYTVLVNLSSGFLTGYLVYLLGEKIPIYNKTIRNERMIDSGLADYSLEFIKAFSLLASTYDTSEMDYLKTIPEIQNFLKPDSTPYSQYVLNVFRTSNNLPDKLGEEFLRLKDSWNKLCDIVCVVDTPVTTIVTNIESKGWKSMLILLAGDIRKKRDQFIIMKTINNLIDNNLDLIRYRQYIKL